MVIGNSFGNCILKGGTWNRRRRHRHQYQETRSRRRKEADQGHRLECIVTAESASLRRRLRVFLSDVDVFARTSGKSTDCQLLDFVYALAHEHANSESFGLRFGRAPVELRHEALSRRTVSEKDRREC
jgi:hypothetical protein